MNRKTTLKQRFQDFIKERQWETPGSYMGPQYHGYVMLISTNRDADILGRSNWEAACEMFPETEDETVIHAGASHWACGWVSYIMIKFDGMEDNLQQRLIMYKALRTWEALQDYPVIDDGLYSEMEHNEYLEYAEQEADSVALVVCKNFGLDESLAEDEDFRELMVQLNIECQYCYGPDSCLASNQYHPKLDGHELDRYRNSIKQVAKNGNAYKHLNMIMELFHVAS